MDIPGKQSGGYPPAPSVGIPAAGVNQYYNPAEHLPPPLQVETQGALTPWSTGLCQCCDDVGNCCITCWCPCVTFGRIAEIIDRGSSSCGMSGALYALIFCVSGCSCLYSCFYRTKLRSQYSLPEGPCPDCLVHCCCESCALCQEYRELKNRGFDMDIGESSTQDQWVSLSLPSLPSQRFYDKDLIGEEIFLNGPASASSNLWLGQSIQCRDIEGISATCRNHRRRFP